MNAKDLFLSCLDHSSRAISQVTEEDYEKHTPDSEWDVKTLANHLLYELSWVPDVVAGRTPYEVGDKYEGDLIGNGNLQNEWQSARDLAIGGVKDCDLYATAHLSWTDATNEFYLKQAAGDHLIHSWDLSTAVGRPIKFNDDVAYAIFDNANPRKDELSSSGLFAPPIGVSEDAPIQTRLLALFGRDINWQPY